MSEFDILALVKCARRELEFRRRVYPRLIGEGRLSAQTAEREIELMKAIVENLEKQGEPFLF